MAATAPPSLDRCWLERNVGYWQLLLLASRKRHTGFIVTKSLETEMNMRSPPSCSRFAATLAFFLAATCQAQIAPASGPAGGTGSETAREAASAAGTAGSAAAGAAASPGRSTPVSASCLEVRDLSDVYVQTVSRSDPPLAAGAASAPAALRHEIEVQVHGLKTLLERARCSGGRKIVLFLNGRPVASARNVSMTLRHLSS